MNVHPRPFCHLQLWSNPTCHPTSLPSGALNKGPFPLIPTPKLSPTQNLCTFLSSDAYRTPSPSSSCEKICLGTGGVGKQQWRTSSPPSSSPSASFFFLLLLLLLLPSFLPSSVLIWISACRLIMISCKVGIIIANTTKDWSFLLPHTYRSRKSSADNECIIWPIFIFFLFLAKVSPNLFSKWLKIICMFLVLLVPRFGQMFLKELLDLSCWVLAW